MGIFLGNFLDVAGKLRASSATVVVAFASGVPSMLKCNCVTAVLGVCAMAAVVVALIGT